MNTKQIIYILMSILFISSCNKQDLADGEEAEEGATLVTEGAISIKGTTTSGTAEGLQETGANADDIISNSNFSSKVKITFNGTNASVDHDVTGVTVKIEGADVIINSTVSEVAYEVTGNSIDGMLKIYSDKKYKLTLDGVNIKNNDGPAINLQSSKRAFIVLNGTNSLEDGLNYANSDEDQKGTFFSEGQMIFSGSGSLNVTANNKHAIVSDDYLRVIDGEITITKAASDGLHANDAIYVDGGTLRITAASDGIEAEKGQIIINDGTINMTVVDDGIVASYEDDDAIDPYIVINGGTINIETTGSGGEGIESKSTLSINGGEIYIKAVDDAINAGSAIFINGGSVVAYSTTNDGIDSNGKLTVTGGRVFAIGARSPEAGFDCDNNTFKITGGLLIGVGGSTSTPTANASSQASAIMGSGSANIIYSVLDSNNGEVITFKSPVNYSTLVLSSSKFNSGESYKLVTVPNVTNATDFYGIYSSGTFNSSSIISNFTLSSMVTNLGGNAAGGGPGGR